MGGAIVRFLPAAWDHTGGVTLHPASATHGNQNA